MKKQSDLDTITKEKISKILQANIGLSGVLCEDLVDSFFNEINNIIKQQHKIVLKNFGSFRINNKSARPGQNLQTGEQILIPPKTVISFSPSKKLKTTINNLTS